MKNNLLFILDFITNGLFAIGLGVGIVFLTAASMVVWGKSLTFGILLIGILGIIGLSLPDERKPKN